MAPVLLLRPSFGGKQNTFGKPEESSEASLAFLFRHLPPVFGCSWISTCDTRCSNCWFSKPDSLDAQTLLQLGSLATFLKWVNTTVILSAFMLHHVEPLNLLDFSWGSFSSIPSNAVQSGWDAIIQVGEISSASCRNILQYSRPAGLTAPVVEMCSYTPKSLIISLLFFSTFCTKPGSKVGFAKCLAPPWTCLSCKGSTSLFCKRSSSCFKRFLLFQEILFFQEISVFQGMSSNPKLEPHSCSCKVLTTSSDNPAHATHGKWEIQPNSIGIKGKITNQINIFCQKKSITKKLK